MCPSAKPAGQSYRVSSIQAIAIVLPFDRAELLAWVEALLRRVPQDKRIPVQSFKFAGVEVDFERAEVRKAGTPGEHGQQGFAALAVPGGPSRPRGAAEGTAANV